MTENAKTGIFAGAAAALGLLAWVTMPRQYSSFKDDSQAMIGKPIFEEFTDPAAAASLKIVKFDDNLGQLKPFELSRDKTTGAWVIPSHDSYPADAASQVSNVANSFIGLRILTVESTKTDDRKMYGVVEPDIAKLEVGDTGVGTLVEMKDDKGGTLVNLVIGKTVRGDDKKRYVRRAGTDPIYSVEFDVEPISTDFSKWIEGDLLKMTSNDIAAISIRDYNILPTSGGQGQLQKNFDADLQFSPVDGKWSAKAIKVYDQGKATERTLTEEEELNTVKINEIKNTLDNLKIVSVARKPKGLAADLKADKELLDDNSKIISLARKGFMPAQRPDGGLELYSTNGELGFKLNDGVEYLLRFGKTTAGDASEEEGAKESTSGVALNRTLFVTARLDESHYPAPGLQKVPETIEELKELEAKEKGEGDESNLPPSEPPSQPKDEPLKSDAAAAKPTEKTEETSPKKSEKSDDAPAAEKAAEKAQEKADASQPTEPTATEPPSPGKTDQSSRSDANLPGKLIRFQAEEEAKASAKEPAAKSEPKDSNVKEVKAGEKKAKPGKKKTNETADKKADSTTEKSNSKEEAKSSSTSSEAKSDTEGKKGPEGDATKEESKAPMKEEKKPAVETEEELKERLEAARERITKENTRAIDEHNDRVNAAKKKAGELNARFAEWYYEITDSEFKRLRASLDDLIKKKTSTPPANSAPGGAPGGVPGAPF